MFKWLCCTVNHSRKVAPYEEVDGDLTDVRFAQQTNINQQTDEEHSEANDQEETKQNYKVDPLLSTLKMDLDKQAKNLFEAVRLGQVDNIKQFLRFTNVNALNEKGETPLIIAAQHRKYVIQKLLMRYGARVNIKDNSGQTALHYECGHGDVQSIHLLLAYGASLNCKDKIGRTPLHYAIASDNEEAVDMLLFCGADATMRDKTGITPIRLNRNPVLKRTLNDSVRTVEAIKNGFIKVETGVLKSNESRHFGNLDCVINTPKTFTKREVYMLARQVVPEFGNKLSQPALGELLLSDTYEFRFSVEDILDEAYIEIPMYSCVEKYEDVHLKTDVNPKIHKDSKRENIKSMDEDEGFVCSMKEDFRKVKAMVLVARPQIEFLQLTGNTETLISTFNGIVRFNIKNGTFSEAGHLVHETIPSANLRNSSLVCRSEFHDISHSMYEQPINDVEVILPVPEYYTDDPNVYTYVLLRSGVPEEHNPEKWQIINRKPERIDNSLRIFVPHFSILSLCQSTLAKDLDIKIDTEKNYQAAIRSMAETRFIAVVKDKTKPHEAIVQTECYTHPRYEERIEALVEDGFIDQNPSFTKDIIVHSGQQFSLQIEGGIRKTTSANIKLTYHPKRDRNGTNLTWFDIEAVNPKDDYSSFGTLFIHTDKQEQIIKRLSSKEEIGNSETLQVKIKINKAEHASLKHFQNVNVFTGDNFIEDVIIKSLTTDDLKVLVKSLYFNTSNDDNDDKKEFLKKKMKEWRDSHLTNVDMGLDQLCSALTKIKMVKKEKDESEAGKIISIFKDIHSRMNSMLKEMKKVKTPFINWLVDILPTPKMNLTECRQPMSDLFLKAMSKKLVEKIGKEAFKQKKKSHLTSFIGQIQINEERINIIAENLLYKEMEIKLYIVLKMIRDRSPSHLYAYRSILHVLEREYPGVYTWFIEMSKKWLQTDNSGGEFHRDIAILLNRPKVHQEDSISQEVSKQHTNDDKSSEETTNEREMTKYKQIDNQQIKPTDNTTNNNNDGIDQMNQNTNQQYNNRQIESDLNKDKNNEQTKEQSISKKENGITESIDMITNEDNQEPTDENKTHTTSEDQQNQATPSSDSPTTDDNKTQTTSDDQQNEAPQSSDSPTIDDNKTQTTSDDQQNEAPQSSDSPTTDDNKTQTTNDDQQNEAPQSSDSPTTDDNKTQTTSDDQQNQATPSSDSPTTDEQYNDVIEMADTITDENYKQTTN